ncbi:unnamed protein product [Bursaphelenchus xylophilus]|uniref:Gamma-secretase subunit PEN-2 n=1 Tax=Bursaphelenchus xylophilus TaxID=6326 RepID=A0A1I7S226_BURXY|nr:unnamed protein product [Bursaphelenchus xylophilus]CAG9090347.1 unnamed protein product [Bursaphelenchus xylophilus]
MASLAKLNLDERLDLCRKYFFIGLLALPFVWLANVLWFGPTIWNKKIAEMEVPEKSMIKYLIGSAVGVVFWTVFASFWVYIYSTNRVNRVEWAESLTFLFPLGRV